MCTLTYLDMNPIHNGNCHEIDSDVNYTNIPLKRYPKDNTDQCESNLNKYDIQHVYNTPCLSRKSMQDSNDTYNQYSLHRNNQTNHMSDAHQINIQTSSPKNSEEKKKNKHTTKIVKYYQSKCLYYYFVVTIINLIICFLYFLNILYNCEKTDFINDKILFGKIDFGNE